MEQSLLIIYFLFQDNSEQCVLKQEEKVVEDEKENEKESIVFFRLDLTKKKYDFICLINE